METGDGREKTVFGTFRLGGWQELRLLARVLCVVMVSACVSWEVERSERRFKAWHVIESSYGRKTNYARTSALEALVEERVSLRSIDLSGFNMREAKLSWGNFNEAKLTGADLRRAELKETNLKAADLSRARLSGAFLVGTLLMEADLRKADLSGATLKDSNLTDANLQGADLRGASFGGALLDRADMGGVKNWHEINDLTGTFCSRVKNPPPGFLKWAKEHGALIDEAQLRREQEAAKAARAAESSASLGKTP